MSQENIEIVRRALAASERGDFDAMLELYAPDVEFIPLRAETEGVFHGRDGVQEFIADTLESFETFELHYELRDLGTHVLAWGTIHLRGSAAESRWTSQRVASSNSTRGRSFAGRTSAPRRRPSKPWGCGSRTFAGTGLVVRHEPQLRPVPFRIEDRRLPLPRQVLEAGGVEQGLVELPTCSAGISMSGG